MLAWPAMDAAPESAARGTPPAVALALRLGAAGLLAWAVFFGGGSGNAAIPWLGTAAVLVAVAVLVGAALGRVALPRLDRAGTTAVLAAAALLGWSALTIWWSIAGDRSWEAVNKGLIVVAFGVVGLAVAGAGAPSVRELALTAAAVIGAALAWALAGKAVPALGPDEAARVARLQAPVGYWNALALLADAAVPLGLWLAVGVRGRAVRGAGALLVFAATLVVLLTQSRAGLLAALAVTALWLVLERERLLAATIALAAALPAVVVGALAFTRPALVEDGGARADRVSDGAVLGVAMLVAAVVAVALVDRLPLDRLAATRRKELLRVLLGGAALIAVVGAVGLVAAVGNPFTWAGDQLGGRGAVVNDPSRFGSLRTNNRTAWWGEAWQVFRAHPGGGAGASTFAVARTRYREDGSFVRQPHSVPMQLLSDTGLPGAVLGALLVVALALGLRATLRRLEGSERAAAAALVCLPAAYALHALVDYDPDFLAVTAPAGLVSAALLGAGRPARRFGAGFLLAAGVVLAGAAGVYALVAPAVSTSRIDAAYAALDAGHVARAASDARSAEALNPLSPDALWARATVAESAGAGAAAEALYVRATQLQPENPATWYELGIYRHISRGDECGAYQALNHAYTLDPSSTLWVKGGPLDQARAAVNAGACERS